MGLKLEMWWWGSVLLAEMLLGLVWVWLMWWWSSARLMGSVMVAELSWWA
jgi:hypothetical protein